MSNEVSWWPKIEHFVSEKFEGKTDKGGEPYVKHLERVSYKSNYTVAGLLHDILEDTDTTVEDLRALNVEELDIKRIQVLTKGKSEKYEDYIDRILAYTDETGDFGALDVKMVDLRDNLDVTRLGRDLDETDLKRLNKYLTALRKLEEYSNE